MRSAWLSSVREACSGKLIWAVALFSVLATISSPAQSFTTLVTFDGPNGIQPWSLVQGNDGNIYGITFLGGNLGACGGSGCGTVFRMTPSGSLTTIYSFSGSDGSSPEALVQGTDGNLYGTTFCTFSNGVSASHSSGRPDGLQRKTPGRESPAVTFCSGPGTIFKLSPSGSLTTLTSVASGTPAFLQASDGNFYGTSSGGGTGGFGIVFKMTPSGALTILYNFSGPDGGFPYGLTQGSDGNFYGTTRQGGTGSQGTVFKITSSGTLTTLHNFTGADGARPFGNMVQGIDGNFYGTTDGGGIHSGCLNNDCGTVFKISPSGTLTTLYNFAGPDGAEPHAGLMQASDENFYGVTDAGGQNAAGTAFRITSSGTLTTLHNFCSQSGCADGESPEGGALLEASNGLLYGSAYLGGDTSGCDPPAGCGTVFSLSAVIPTANQLVPLTPCRLVDTRQGSPVQGGTFTIFDLPQLAQTQGCGDLSSATSYSLNVTVVPHGQLNYLTIWPAGRTQPYVSTMNSTDGRTKANAAIVPAGASGAVSVYVTDTSDVILDIDGYFTAPGSQTLQFYPLVPCRVVDTRQTNFPQGLGAPSFGAMEARELPVFSNSPCLQTLTQTPQAYSFNVTAVPKPGGHRLGYLTIWPSEEQQPVVSTLNNPTGTVVANAAIVASDPANGDVTVFTSDSTDVIIDVNGFFAPPSAGYSLYTAVPCRAYDSRANNGQPFSGERTVNIAGSPCAPPSNAMAYVFNATVVPNGSLGYLTLWADGQMQPVVSTLNAYDGFVTSNLAIVPNGNGSTDAYAGDGSTQLILDISGYFAP